MMILYYEYEILTSGPDRTNATHLKCCWESMAGVQSDHLDRDRSIFYGCLVKFIPFLLEMLPKKNKNPSFSFFLGCTDKHEKNVASAWSSFFVYSSQHDRVGILYCNTTEPGRDTAPQTMDVWWQNNWRCKKTFQSSQVIWPSKNRSSQF